MLHSMLKFLLSRVLFMEMITKRTLFFLFLAHQSRGRVLEKESVKPFCRKPGKSRSWQYQKGYTLHMKEVYLCFFFESVSSEAKTSRIILLLHMPRPEQVSKRLSNPPRSSLLYWIYIGITLLQYKFHFCIASVVIFFSKCFSHHLGGILDCQIFKGTVSPYRSKNASPWGGTLFKLQE